MVVLGVIGFVRATGQAHRDPAKPSDSPAGSPAAGLGHRDCRSLYFRQAKLLWGSGTLTRRDRALLDQLRVGLHLTITEAAKLESAAARVVATCEELAAQEESQLVQTRSKAGPWALWHSKPRGDSS